LSGHAPGAGCNFNPTRPPAVAAFTHKKERDAVSSFNINLASS
jgi:hypothetical protein